MLKPLKVVSGSVLVHSGHFSQIAMPKEQQRKNSQFASLDVKPVATKWEVGL